MRRARSSQRPKARLVMGLNWAGVKHQQVSAKTVPTASIPAILRTTCSEPIQTQPDQLAAPTISESHVTLTAHLPSSALLASCFPPTAPA